MLARGLKYLSFLTVFLLLMNVGGVFATWNYAQGAVPAISAYTDPKSSTFEYAPEIILPSQDVGKNYLDLLQSILDNIKGGLNSSKDTLEKALIESKILHSSENVQGGNLKHLFVTEESRFLEFVIEYESATEFHLLIYEDDEMDAATVDVTYVKAFQAILRYANGEWSSPEATVGYAMARRMSGTSGSKWMLPDEWVPGLLPSELEQN